MDRVGSISVSISALAAENNADVAQALKAVTEEVANSVDLSGPLRTETLDQLDEISRQAALPQSSRAPAGVIKSILTGIGATLGSAGGLAGVWSTWGGSIRSFFGM